MMPTETAKLQSIAARLDGIRASIRRLFVLDGLARLLLAICAFAVVTFLLDYALMLPRPVRIVFLLGGLAGFGWIAARRIIFPATLKISDDDLALFVERHYPELNDRLISAIQLARSEGAARVDGLSRGAASGEPAADRVAGFNSPELVDALVDDASAAAASLDFRGVLVRTHVKRIATAAAVFALVLTAAAGATRDTRNLAGIWARRALGMDVRWPQRTTLDVLDFDAVTRTKTVARGDDLLLVIGYSGTRPGRVRLEYTFEGGDRRTESMIESAARRFTHTFTRVNGPFEFRATGGDDTTDTYRVLVKNPPSVEEMRLFLKYPAYLQMQDTPEDQPILGGNVAAPQYTMARFVAVCNEDIAEAKIRQGTRGKEAEAPLTVLKDERGAPRLVSGTLEVLEPYSEYQLLLKAVNGLPNRDLIRYTIKGQVDSKPTIHMYDPLGEENVSDICERPISAEVKDDNGIAEIFFDVRTEGKAATDWVPLRMTAEHMKPTSYGPGVKSIRIEHVLNFRSLKVVVGDTVRIRFRATDYKEVRGDRNVSTGKEYRFTVVPLTQLEKELQDQLEKVKQNLEQLRRRQVQLYEKAERLDRNFASVEQLNPEQAGEIRYSGNEQSGITDKLAGARTDIERIRRRGVYNKVFDERASEDLTGAVEALDGAVAPNGPSPAATMLFRDASKERSAARSQMLNRARGNQSQVIQAIDVALRYLDRWSTYQEIVRIVRFVLEEQQRVIDMVGGGK